MALAAVKTFVTGEVLYAADLNALNTNILNNALSLISPLTGTLNANNNQLTNLRLENLGALPSAAQVGRIWWDTADVEAYLDTGSRIVRPFTTAVNRLLNGGFLVWQRGTTFTSTTTPANSDDTYLADRWILLADGADTVDVTQETSVLPGPGSSAIRLDVETGNRKFGLLQILEARDALPLLTGRVSLSFQARVTGTSIANMRAGILHWTGAADAVTSDIVSAWNAAGTNPSLVANWVLDSTPANFALTTAYQTFRVENVSIGATGSSNVAVFLWIDDTDATVGDFLYITSVNLVEGRTALDFESRPRVLEEAACQRYAYSLTPGLSMLLGFGNSYSTTTANVGHSFPQRMRAVPALTLESVVCFMLGDGAGTNIGASNVVAVATTVDFGGYTVTVDAGLTAGRSVPFLTSSLTNRNLIWDAEL